MTKTLIFYPNLFGPKIFRDPKLFEPRFFNPTSLRLQIFGPIICLDQNNSWTTFFQTKNSFRPIFFLPNIFLTQIFLELNFLDPIFFFWLKIFLDPKFSFGTGFFLTQNRAEIPFFSFFEFFTGRKMFFCSKKGFLALRLRNLSPPQNNFRPKILQLPTCNMELSCLFSSSCIIRVWNS